MMMGSMASGEVVASGAEGEPLAGGKEDIGGGAGGDDEGEAVGAGVGEGDFAVRGGDDALEVRQVGGMGLYLEAVF